MTIPAGNNSSNNNNTENNNNNNEINIKPKKSHTNTTEENIYQPIWQFKTVGTEQHNECDYEELQSSATKALDVQTGNIDDDGEWETDDEFMFSSGQHNSQEVMTQSSSTLDTDDNSSYKTIGIFYSPTEANLKAIKYDYDAIKVWKYFANTTNSRPQLLTNLDDLKHKLSKQKIQQSNPPTINVLNPTNILPDSVQAWKFMLLDVNYLEDEEDMIVNRAALLGLTEQKSIDSQSDTGELRPPSMQIFKSVSIGNLLDIPDEEYKKSIPERMRDKLSRGVLKLNMRSPKREKRTFNIFRRAQVKSLSLDDEFHPKYPIFGASLDEMDLTNNQYSNVPRFVVDCVKYIERHDNICQDGLYRVSGNKSMIEALKKTLSERFIYDASLLNSDDIHTVTSLFKQFFRELKTPLIPDESLAALQRISITENNTRTISKIFSQINEPNRSTIKFLIQHLTNIATWSSVNLMTAANLAIVWGPCLLSRNQIQLGISQTNTLAKILIENYARIFEKNERYIC